MRGNHAAPEREVVLPYLQLQSIEEKEKGKILIVL
jgi:hypothetical protein